jgi:drug/metabolite transporter (DMT)-like permease
MKVILAAISLIILWSLTPLAIKWSGEGPGYLFGVLARMSLGLLGVVPVLFIRQTPLALDPNALRSYVAGAVQIFGSMWLTYWASQHIASGWIAVVFGLTPLLTAPLAHSFLGEASLTPLKLLSYILGLLGLALIFQSALNLSNASAMGIAAVLLAALGQAISAVWIKAIHRQLDGFVQVAGSLMIAVPLFTITWFLLDGTIPGHIAPRSLYSILFLGLIATTFGFSLYFYILKHLQVSRVAMVTLVTPVMSLGVGHLMNHEPLHGSVLAGTGLILSGLILFEWKGAPKKGLSPARSQGPGRLKR